MYFKFYDLGFVLALLITMVCMGCESYNHSIVDSNQIIELKIDSLLSKMTLEEKIGQTCQRGTSSRIKGPLSEELKTAVRTGMVGSMINVMNNEYVDELQRNAVKESPNGIPLIFGRDVIHGFKTIFPIPLGQAATFNPELVTEGSRIAAKEATTAGIRWTFAPMLDISRDPRWGRIAESSGEDPYLTEVMGAASIAGFQGDEMSDPYRIASCAKHFAGYGAAEGGRDYNTAMISDDQLQNVYLRPFAKAVQAGAATFMTSFNDLNGVPASGNEFLLKQMLRDQWKFDGFVVSDWNSITEMIPHGFCQDEKEAAQKAANAGLDMEMMSKSYENNLKSLIDEKKFSTAQLDEMVRNILRIKFRLGLFDNTSFDKNKDILYAEEHLAAAKQAAIESVVLLKNENNALPISKDIRKIAVIGPLADAPLDQLGTWIFDGEKEHTITPLTALRSALGSEKVSYAPGLTFSRDREVSGFSTASQVASSADAIVFFAGEEAILSGEAHSRANIDLPGEQVKLIKQLALLNKPIILVIMAGRPITLGNIIDDVDAVLFAWHPGTMGGPALADLILGEVSPSGRLPITWPKSVGTIPIYYNHKNTGRPANSDKYVQMYDIPVGAWQSSLGNESHYLDEGYDPMYHFGFGLTYSEIAYSNLQISTTQLPLNGEMKVTIEIKNIGLKDVQEVVQLYFQDRFASVTRPVKELLRFKKIFIKAGEKQIVTFDFKADDLKFYNIDQEWKTEPGEFNLWVGKDAATGLTAVFNVVE